MAGSVGILQQRLIEADIIRAFYNSFAKEFGTEHARAFVGRVIGELAFEKGRELRKAHPDGDLAGLIGLWQKLSQGGALDIDFIEQSPDCLHMRVKRCGYAEAYRGMGIDAGLGNILSCARDEPLLRGYSDGIMLERSRTIMDGAKFCELIYKVKK